MSAREDGAERDGAATPVRVPVEDPDRWPPDPPETVTVHDPEAASHWDARCWRSA